MALDRRQLPKEAENLWLRALIVALVIFGLPPLWCALGQVSFSKYAKERRQIQEDLTEMKRRIRQWKASKLTFYAPEQDLVRNDLCKDLLDPFTGEPYMYKKSSQQQYYIYSVGPDKKDDDAERGSDDILWRTVDY
jgi:hypothetical protein